jgi:hypothetical protein
MATPTIDYPCYEGPIATGFAIASSVEVALPLPRAQGVLSMVVDSIIVSGTGTAGAGAIIEIQRVSDDTVLWRAIIDNTVSVTGTKFFSVIAPPGGIYRSNAGSPMQVVVNAGGGASINVMVRTHEETANA